MRLRRHAMPLLLLITGFAINPWPAIGQTSSNIAPTSASQPADLHPTITTDGGILHRSEETGFTRITIAKAPTDAEPYGYTTFQQATFTPDRPIFDFWIRVQGRHTAAFCLGFGKAGLGYGNGPPYAFSPHNYMLNLHGRQYWPDTDNFGTLGPLEEGVWHHIVYDLDFALQARMQTDLKTIGQASLALYDFQPATLLLAGGPAQPVPATIDLRDMTIRARRPGETYFNDLELEVAASSLGHDADGKNKYLIAGSVLSRAARGATSLEVMAGDAAPVGVELGTVQTRAPFKQMISIPAGVTSVRIKLSSLDQMLVERTLELPPALTYLQKATLHLIPTSHQDVAWLDTPQNTGIWRREQGIDRAIDLLEKNSDYRYGLEHTYSLMDYLNHEPLKAQTVQKLIKEGRLTFGAMYNQPYQSLWGGESLLRQMYYGRKWLRETYGPDVPCQVAWNTDTPETAWQLPQIFAKSGVKYFMQGRFRPGLFDWFSPDGSKVTVDTLSIYGLLAPYLKPFDSLHVAMQTPELMQYWDAFFQQHKLPAQFPISDMGDFSPPTAEFIPLVREWNTKGREEHGAGFSIQFSSADQFMDELTRSPETKFPELRGEWVNQWGYIVPTQFRMVAAGREAAWALSSAEKFWALRFMTPYQAEPYQRELFDEAWKAHIHFDHGPGGLNGDITDQYFLSLEEKSLRLGRALLDSAVRWIAERAKPLDEKSTKLVVLNPLSWERTGPAYVELSMPPGQAPVVTASDGSSVSIQRLPQVHGGTTRYVLAAKQIPSVGYSTFKVNFIEKIEPSPAVESFTQRVYENEFYRLEFAPGGLKSIYDRQLQRELLDTSEFLGGELFALNSFGGDSSSLNGHGEVAQPSWERIERASQYQPSWTTIEAGPVRDGWHMETPFLDATLRLELFAYHGSRRLEFNVSVLRWSGAIYREYRMAFPVAIREGRVAYDVPYGVMEVGRDELPGAPWPGGWDDTASSSTHPRYVQNWMSAGNDDFTVAVSSLASNWDYLDRHEKRDRFTLLQPILLASRHSGHPLGNYYAPPGDFKFTFGLTSFAGDWRQNHNFGDEMNAPFPAVAITSLFGPEADRVKGRINAPQPPMPDHAHGPLGSMSALLRMGTDPALPASLSLCRVSDSNYVISALKVADDGKGFIVRGFERTGRDTDVSLEFPLNAIGAQATNLIEENSSQTLTIQSGTVEFKAGHHAINALRLNGTWKP